MWSTLGIGQVLWMMIMMNGQFSSRETTQADYNTDNIYIYIYIILAVNDYKQVWRWFCIYKCI